MLVLSGITGLMSHFDFYPEVYTYLSDLIGYSLLTNIVMYRIYRTRKYCNSTRLAVVGLIIMNIVSIAGHFLEMYSPLYDTYIVVMILMVVGYFINETDE